MAGLGVTVMLLFTHDAVTGWPVVWLVPVCFGALLGRGQRWMRAPEL